MSKPATRRKYGTRRLFMTAVGASVALLLVLPSLNALALDRSTPGCRLELAPTGVLDGRAYDASLVEVMREISRVTGAEVVGLPDGDATRVSFVFDHVPVAQALARILRDRNYTVLLRPSAGHLQLARVTLVGGSSQPAELRSNTEPESWFSGDEFLDGRAPETRDPLLLTPGENFAPGRDVTERMSALEELKETGALNTDNLFQIVAVDPDREIRARAFEMLEMEANSDPITAKRLQLFEGQKSDVQALW